MCFENWMPRVTLRARSFPFREAGYMRGYPTMRKLPSGVKRVAFYNNKGGGGKTTLSAHTALLAEEWRVNTILACLDRQGNSLVWLSGGDAIAKVDSFYERSPCIGSAGTRQVGGLTNGGLTVEVRG